MPHLTNCILILKTLEGYYVSYIEDVNELFWKKVEGTEIQYEEKENLSSEELLKYFGTSEIYPTKDLAWHQAVMIYREYVNKGVKFMKGNIRYLTGYEGSTLL